MNHPTASQNAPQESHCVASVTPNAANQERPESGRTISYWRLGAQVTGGRWTQIYRAAPKSLAQHAAYDYAIKIINPELPAELTGAALERLGREAAATDSIQHHGIIPLLDAELDHPTFFLVQPWVTGGTLDRFTAAATDISLVRCLWILRQIAEALAAAHDKQRVYLGLDPSHVLLGSGGRIMLTGWSNSVVEGQPLSVDLDKYSFAQYMAPENFGDAPRANTRSDVFSLGLLTHRLIAGKLPYRESNLEQVIVNRQTDRPVELIRLQPSTPSALSELVESMLEIQPLNRPTIREALERLISIEIDNLKNPSLITL